MATQNKGYLGNQNLKQIGQVLEFTQEQIDEYKKCSKSVDYFLENYAKIVSLDEGIVNFKPFPYQKRALKSIQKNRKTVLMIARQLGKCVSFNATHYIRNKVTGEIMEVTAEQFHEMCRSKEE